MVEQVGKRNCTSCKAYWLSRILQREEILWAQVKLIFKGIEDPGEFSWKMQNKERNSEMTSYKGHRLKSTLSKQLTWKHVQLTTGSFIPDVQISLQFTSRNLDCFLICINIDETSLHSLKFTAGTSFFILPRNWHKRSYSLWQHIQPVLN